MSKNSAYHSVSRGNAVKMASAAAALLVTFTGCADAHDDEHAAHMSGTMSETRSETMDESHAGHANHSANAGEQTEGPVKVSQCENLAEEGLVSISSGNDAFSAALCQALGGSQSGSLSAQVDEAIGGNSVTATYCNDVFTCAGLSACKGNDNNACAGQNSCHGIGFVGIYSTDQTLSESLCDKLGGTVLSSL